MKHIFTAMLAAFVLLALLAGCTPAVTEPSAPPAPSASPSTEPVEQDEKFPEVPDGAGTQPVFLPSAEPSITPEPSAEPSITPEPSAAPSAAPTRDPYIYIGAVGYYPWDPAVTATDDDDLTQLGRMTQLEQLTLTVTYLPDFDFSLITDLPKLRQLHLILPDADGLDLSPLVHSSLDSLELSFTSELDTLALPAFDNLTSVTVNTNAGIAALTLADSPALNYLNLGGSGRIEALRVDGCAGLDRLLAGCGGVGSVTLGERAEDFLLFLYCTLDSLDCSGASVHATLYCSGFDLAALAGCAGLTSITLDDEYTYDLSALPLLSALEHISLRVEAQSGEPEVPSAGEHPLLSSKLDPSGKEAHISIHSTEELGLDPERHAVYPPDSLRSLSTRLDAAQLDRLVAFCEDGGRVTLHGF